MDVPFCQYRGHTSDLLDVSWSKNYFILTSSMDKTVRLWHISRRECLCCFQHIDFVTAICFHPRNDQFFLSGSLDGKLRLWNIPDKKVALWNEVDGASKLITTANFIQVSYQNNSIWIFAPKTHNFCPKIQLWFPEKIVEIFWGEKLVKMLWFWTF